ncbi:MAG TPA: (2Fe-2S)-binding protein [Acidimicrobiales bacterium]|nr:(2Fe-2S)-binding protein [Acidimicrobiales bacterium]
MKLEMNVNGTDRAVEIDAHDSLLDVLRDVLHLTGTKEACGEGECGACTVIVDGVPVNSCIRAAMTADGATVTTVEGLADGDELSGLQRAFLDNAGIQCGFCTPGLLMTLTALHDNEPHPDRELVKKAIVGNLCRCTGYSQVIEAAVSAGTGGGEV